MTPSNLKKVIVVTGGNRGIGSGIVELFCQKNDIDNKIIIIGNKNEKNAKDKINELKDFYPLAKDSLYSHQLDLNCNDSIGNFSNYIKKNFQHVDILYNNAAIMNKHKKPITDLEVREHDINSTFQINFWGMVNLTENLIPLIQDGGHIVGLTTAYARFKLSKRINEVFVNKNLKMEDLESLYTEYKKIFVDNQIQNSEWDDKNPIYGCYNISKMFLGAYTLLLKNRFVRENKNIKVNCVTPGWCKTDMGGLEAPRTHLEGAETCAWLESLPAERNDMISGNLYYDKKKLSWI